MISVLALGALFISLLCSSQVALRGYGIISALLYCLAYWEDGVIIVTNVMILLAHIKWLMCSGMTWRQVLDDMLM